MAESLIIQIGAKADRFEKELKRLKSQTANFEKSLAKAAKVSAVAFAGLAAAVGKAVKDFSNFEKTFTNVQTLLDKSSFKTKSFTRGVNDLRNDVLKLGAESGESFESLNQGLFDLVSAGVPAEQATASLADAVNLATAGATDTATAVKALTAAITAYGKEAGTSEEVAQKFFTAQKFGVTTVAQLATGFNKVAGTAKTLGVNFNEILAASTALTANGAKPTKEAFTEVAAVLNSVILAQDKLKTQSADVQAALSLQNIEQNGLVQSLNDLSVAVGGDVVQIQKLLGSSEALSAVLSLTGQQAGTFDKILTELNDEQARAVAFNDALATKQATTEKSLARLSRSFEAISIQIGERFAPLLNEVADSLSAIAKQFNTLSDEQKDAIADFIKAGLVISAAVTAVGTFGLAVIKITRFIKALRFALVGARIAAGAFISTATLGLGTILAFLPEIISGAKVLIGLFNKGDEVKGLASINAELSSLREKQVELEKTANINRLGQKNRSQERLEEIQSEIAKLEELRKKRVGAGDDANFGTGSLLVRPELSGGDKGAFDKTLENKPVEVPVNYVVDPDAKDEVVAQTKDIVTKNKAVRSRAEAEALQSEIDRNEQLKLLRAGASDEELDFLRRKQELDTQRRDVELEKDKDLAAKKKENIELLNSQLLAEESDFQAKKLEQKIEFTENEKALDEELRAIDLEERAKLNEEDLNELRGQLNTKKEAEREVAKDKIKADIARRNAFLKDEAKFGTSIAKLRQFVNSKEVQGAENTANNLAKLQRSKSKTLKGIGKRAAQAQIIIDTAKGALSAYSSVAGLGPVGAVIGTALAGALVAFGAEQLAEVNKAQRGGLVPSTGGRGGLRDRVPALLEPNELVVPKSLVPDFIQAVGRPDAQGEARDNEDAGGVAYVEIAIEDEAASMITARQRENSQLARGVI